MSALRYMALLKDTLVEMAAQPLFYVGLILLLLIAIALGSVRLETGSDREQGEWWAVRAASVATERARSLGQPVVREDAGTDAKAIRFRVRWPDRGDGPGDAQLDRVARETARGLYSVPENPIAAFLVPRPIVRIRREEGAYVLEGEFASEYPYELPRVRRVSLFFGLLRIEDLNPPQPAAGRYVLWWLVLAGVVRFGLIVFLIVATAGFVPAMMRPGRLALTLSRPVSRPGVLLAKYAGGLLYALVMTCAVIGPAWVSMASQTSIWWPRPLAAIPAMLATFAILYSAAVFVGVISRSAIATILATLFIWVIGALADFARGLVQHIPNAPDSWKTGVDIVYFVFPKSSAVAEIFTDAITTLPTTQPNAILEALTAGQQIRPTDWGMIASSGALFTAAMLGAAIWSLHRKDV